MRLYTTTSTAEKQRMVEANERRVREQQQQQQQQQLQLQQQQMEMQAQMEQQKEQLEYQKHQEDNETKVLVAQINASAEWDRYAMIQEENGITKQQELEYKNKQLELDAKQFDEKLALDKKKQQDDARLKEKQIAKTASKK
jgi:Ca-activated chloride channel family protein